MEQINITLTFDGEQLEALEYYLQKDKSSVQKRMDEALRHLYEDTVPEVLREYLERNTQPSAKPKRPPRPSQPKPAPAPAPKPTDQTTMHEEGQQ